MFYKKVFFVRHGQSVANQSALFGLDQPLSDEGIGQALEAKIYFDCIRDDLGLLVSSDMERAIGTAKRIFPDRNTLILDKRFREIHFGLLEGKPLTDEILKELQEDPLRIKTKYQGDDVWVRAKKAVQALQTYISLSVGDVVLIGHDTLFECMLQQVGYYDMANGGETPFLLWADRCRFSNCGILKVDSSFFLRKRMVCGAK